MWAGKGWTRARGESRARLFLLVGVLSVHIDPLGLGLPDAHRDFDSWGERHLRHPWQRGSGQVRGNGNVYSESRGKGGAGFAIAEALQGPSRDSSCRRLWVAALRTFCVNWGTHPMLSVMV